MISEFAAYYGGAPAPSMAWPLFLACVDRVGRHEARRQLSTLDAVSRAVVGAFPANGESGEFTHARDRLVRRAYPVKGTPQVFVPNLFAPAEEEVSDGR